MGMIYLLQSPSFYTPLLNVLMVLTSCLFSIHIFVHNTLVHLTSFFWSNPSIYVSYCVKILTWTFYIFFKVVNKIHCEWQKNKTVDYLKASSAFECPLKEMSIKQQENSRVKGSRAADLLFFPLLLIGFQVWSNLLGEPLVLSELGLRVACGPHVWWEKQGERERRRGVTDPNNKVKHQRVTGLSDTVCSHRVNPSVHRSSELELKGWPMQERDSSRMHQPQQAHSIGRSI